MLYGYIVGETVSQSGVSRFERHIPLVKRAGKLKELGHCGPRTVFDAF